MYSKRRFVIRAFSVAIFAILALVRLPAAAQSEEQSGNDYEAFIAQGVNEFALGNWAEARSSFYKAHRINPNARTLRGLGMTAFEMRKYAEAVRDLEASLAEPRKRLTEQHRAEVRSLLAKARGYLGKYRVILHPANANIRLDGKPVKLDANDALLVELGEHEVAASADGYEPAREFLKVLGGEEGEITLSLKPTAGVAPAAVPGEAPGAVKPETPAAAEPQTDGQAEEAEPMQPGEPFTLSGRVWTWVALGSSAVLGGISAYFWLKGDSQIEELERECAPTCTAEEISSAKTSDLLTNVFLGASIACAAGAVVLFFAESPGDTEAEPKKTDAVSLDVGPGSAGIRGAF